MGEKNGFEGARTLMQLDPGRAWLPGLVAELARGYYWKLVHDLPDPDDRDDLSKALLKSMNAPIDPHTLGRIAAWMSGVPASSPWSLLDFFYLEQRLGCWAGVICYPYADMVRFVLWPLNSRRLVARRRRGCGCFGRWPILCGPRESCARSGPCERCASKHDAN